MLSNILNSKYCCRLSAETRRKFAAWYSHYRAQHPGTVRVLSGVWGTVQVLSGVFGNLQVLSGVVGTV